MTERTLRRWLLKNGRAIKHERQKQQRAANRARVQSVLQDHPKAGPSEIARRTSLNRMTVYAILREQQ